MGIAGLIVAELLIFSWIGNAVEDSTPATPSTVTTIDQPADPVDTYEITAADVVDTMTAAQIQTFADAYYQTGDNDLALASFTEGYGYGQDPSAQEVFDELLTRI